MSSVALSSALADLDFVHLPSWNLPGLLTCTESGSISIISPSGTLLTSFDSGHSVSHCSCSASAQEITIGTTDSYYLRIHQVELNSTQPYPIKLLSDLKLFENNQTSLKAFTQYTRIGKKMWICGDSEGFLTVLANDGELLGKAYGKVGEIQFIEKSGQQLVVAGKKKIGVFNTGNIEVSSLCTEPINDIISLTLDLAPAIVYAALANGEIIVYDTRYSVGSGPSYCKAIYLFTSRFPGRLASVANSLLLWSSGQLAAFNTSFLEYDSVNPPQYYSLPLLNSDKIKSYRTSQENVVFITSNEEVKMYKLQNPINQVAEVSSSPIDFGWLRIIGFILVLIFIVIWKSKGRKSKRELEVERLEKSLEELQRSMESTTKISEDLTSRFKNVEESTKNLRF